MNFLSLLSCSEKEEKQEYQKCDLDNQLRGKNNLLNNSGSRDFFKTLTSLNAETTNCLQVSDADRSRKYVKENFARCQIFELK